MFAAAGAVVLALVSAVPAAAQAPVPAASACARSCLVRRVDDYLAALAAHDPSRLKLAAGARFTENGSDLQLGDGLWGTIGKLGSDRSYFTNERTGEIVLFTTIRENGFPAMLTVRLKVTSDGLSEIETVVVRQLSSGGLFQPERFKAEPAWNEILPPAQRTSAERLKAIVQSYLDGIEHNSGEKIPFAPGAHRSENGVATTSGPAGRLVMKGSEGTVDFGTLDMADQFSRAANSYIHSIDPRRYTVIDEERGVVLGFFRFNVPGTTQTFSVRGAGIVPVGDRYRVPKSAVIVEAFKIVNGQITLIEAFMLDCPYKMSDGWSGTKVAGAR